MLIGTTLHQGIDALTDWMETPEINGYVSLQLVAVSHTDVDIEFQIYHRNHDESGNGTAYGTAETIQGTETLPKIATISATGLKQQWRLRIKAKNGASNEAWAHFQLPSPSFYASAS